MTGRDDFTVRTKKTLALRAAHFCSKPSCRKLTAAPHSDPEKSLTTGHAAHIHAAAPGGPRYDPNQTPAERKAIANGIWLCRECGDDVDKDEVTYPADKLRSWKSAHETLIAEIHTKGYASSIALLQSRAVEPQMARKILLVLEDRRALWAVIDAETPSHVVQSLDILRSELVRVRGELDPASPLNGVLAGMSKTIHFFFNSMGFSDLHGLCCDRDNPEWQQFADALEVLRKSLGFQIADIARTHGLTVSEDLAFIMPELPPA